MVFTHRVFHKFAFKKLYSAPSR